VANASRDPWAGSRHRASRSWCRPRRAFLSQAAGKLT
jgi:hypothetical protein